MSVRLPYNRVVDVSVTKLDRFATTQGFQTMLVVGTVIKAGHVDATSRTKLYANLDEMAADGWLTSDEPYKAASTIFSRRPAPRQIKIGYRNPANPIADEMNLIYAFDSDWYWLTTTREVADTADQTALATWAETRNIFHGTDTNDADTENAGSSAHNSHVLKTAKRERTAGFYHTTAGTYLAASALAFCASRDFDRANYREAQRGRIDSGQAYTLKFKGCPGVAPIDKASAAIQAITGFVPGLGLDAAQGHLCNTYVNIGGLDLLVEGNTYSGAFVDEIHALDWLRARVQESVLSLLANTPRIPYTNPGVGFLIENAIHPPLRRAVAAGIIAGDLVEGGDFQPEFEISVDRVEDVPAAQRRNRIAPDIKIRFRYAGALHYVSVSMIVRF